MKNVWKQRFNFIIPIVILSLIAIVMIFATSKNWSGTVEQMEKELGEQVVNQASLLCSEMDNTTSVLSGLAATFVKEDVDNQENMIDKLRRCAEKTGFVTVSYIYPDGYLRRSDGRGLDVSDRWYFEKGIGGETFVAVLKNSEMDDSPKVGMGVPVWIEGNVAGILMGTYDTETFREMFEECISGNNELSYICSSDGGYIIGTKAAEEIMEGYHPGFAQNGNFFDVLAKSDFSKSSAEFVKDTMASMSGGQAAYTYRGEKRYTTYEPMGINDWFMVSVLPEEQIYMQAMRTASFSYIMLALVMIIIIGMILFLAYYEHKQALKEKKRVKEI